MGSIGVGSQAEAVASASRGGTQAGPSIARRRTGLRRVVELRYFAGMPVVDIAEVLGVSTRTVERDWVQARLFPRVQI